MEEPDTTQEYDFDFEKSIDKTKLKYALYLRKSSEDEGHQAHSIEDQKKECLECARRLGITLDLERDVFEEDKSARYPNNRKMFSALIKKIKAGVYDGIIAYHPDRLSRNMLEAGMILDMLKPTKGAESSVLKDLVFPTVAFHNDSGGRLLLSVLFSMATQYSEHLQEVVKRGVRSHHKEGKSSGSHKWGYKRSPQGLYVPDENWDRIKKGWDMVLNGKSQTDVLKFWEAQDVHYYTQEKENKPSKRVSLTAKSKTIASRHFHDPFAFGILCQAGRETDLRIVQPSFKPLVTDEEYNIVQTLLAKDGKATRKHTRKEIFLPFRNMVRCKCCHKLMYPSPVKNHPSTPYRMVYYYCQNKNCIRRQDKNIPSGIRGRDLLNELYRVLDNLQLSEESYKEYSETVDELSDLKIDELREQRQSLLGQRAQLTKKRNERSENLEVLLANKTTPKVTIENCTRAIEELQNQIIDIDEELKEIQSKTRSPEQIKATKEEFLNLIQNIGKQMRNASPVEKDIIARKLFLNLIVDEQNKLSVICKPDFEGLISFANSENVQFGGDMWT